MITLQNNELVSQNATMMVISLSLGALIGEFLGLEERIEHFGQFIKQRSGNMKDVHFVEAFVTTSLTICVGAMVVVGTIQDGLYHNPTILYTKSVLYFFFVMMMGASLGKGSGYSVISIALFQLPITILAYYIEPIFIPLAITNLSFVGSVLIFEVGINLLFGKTIKISNLLPSLLVAVGYAFLF